MPFPSEFKKDDFASNIKKLYFIFTTNSVKDDGPIRQIKYKHGVEVDFDWRGRGCAAGLISRESGRVS